MQLSDIIRQVNRDLDEDYSNGDIIDWINRCIDDLAPIAKKEAKTTFAIDSNNSYTMPTDFLEFVDVLTVKADPDNAANRHYTVLTQLPQQDYTSTGFKYWAGTLSLQNPPSEGTIEVFYNAKPAYMAATNLNAVPQIDESFHDLFILYAIGQLQFTEEDYDDRPDTLNRYYARKAEFEAHTNRKTTGMYQIKVVDW
ncbi:hypothetical protein [Brevibacillus centrosporus]|uniref:phage adaptor protein n=1 Tax=Brevibacillus centrosporus TaxID=54910 RepID=UPI002E22F9ED|nr:hypothetical protein [Brevibacillus centrosporus]